MAEAKQPLVTTSSTVVQSIEITKDLLHLGRLLAPRLEALSRFIAETKDWRVYERGCWLMDYDDVYISKRVSSEMYLLHKELLAAALTKAERDEIDQFFTKLYNPSGVKQVTRSCAINLNKNIVAKVDDFDRDPMLLNCINGTVSLRDGLLSEHNPMAMLTKQVAVEFDPKANCPVWLETVSAIMSNNKEKVSYLQRVLGYGITGSTEEHCFFLWYGNGANGKSTIFEIVRELGADYVGNLPNESLLLNFRTVRSDIVRIQGCRIVTTSELKEHSRPLDEALVKQLTSGDCTTARESGKNEVDFTPQLKLFVATNHLPTIRGIDNGIWRRVRLISFNESFEGEKCDKNLMEKLREELPGILNWLIEGCLQWQQLGLNEPEVVANEISRFRADSNPVKLFLDDRCEDLTGARVQLKDLYQEYLVWCDENCYTADKVISFGKRMVALGFEKGKSGSVRFWRDLQLKASANLICVPDSTGQDGDGKEPFGIAPEISPGMNIDGAVSVRPDDELVQ